METGILLESGTNELEILEFKVGKNYYGINVAKIREIISYQTPTPIPNADPRIEGIFMPRDEIISIIDLAEVMHLEKPDKVTNDMYIVTNFNQLNTAFHVNGVLGIHRVSWSDIVKPDSTINTAGEGMATGIIRIDDKLIIILDFEIVNCLGQAGYTNLTTTDNGKECWDKLQQYLNEGNVDDNVSCIITDIEMPQMDGHRLTKLVKEHDKLKHIPLIIFSSLVNAEMRRKGEQLGADAQLSKPEIGQLVGAIDSLIGSTGA